MEEILVSVIVPVYKVEKYLSRCVKSIQQQTYGKLEIILVDDGSPDGCPQICDELATQIRESRLFIKKTAVCQMPEMSVFGHLQGNIWLLWTAMMILHLK